MCSGYHAVGTLITLVTIKADVHKQGQAVVQDIFTQDLSTRQGRIKNAATMIKLVKVLRLLENAIQQNVDADMLPLFL